MAELDTRAKRSDSRIQRIIHQLFSLQTEQEEMKKRNREYISDLHEHIQQSEDRFNTAMNDKFNALTRRLDKMTTSEEASTVKFKSAVEDRDSFHQMTSVVSELIDKRNKNVKYSGVDTPVRPKQPDLQQASMPNISKQAPEQLPQIGLSPVQLQERQIDDPGKTNNTLSSKDNLLGPSALQPSNPGRVSVITSDRLAQPVFFQATNFICWLWDYSTQFWHI